ncbi:hypothetical protein TKK_0008220 [Trichogramma kaykai]
MLCEMHFADNAWEIRKGKRQLLQNAVPTIFANRVIHQDNLSLPENQEIAQATSHSQEEKDCHHLKLKITSKFYAYRLKIKSSKQKKIDKNYIYASKSVAMREIVK